MMASFLPVIFGEQKEQRNKEKYAFYYSVWKIHINSEKNTQKKKKKLLCMYLPL